MNNQTHRFNISRMLHMFFSILLVFLAAVSVSATTRNPRSDFDGDGKSDIAVFRPSDGYWYISKSSGGYLFIKWGLSGDTLVPGDYDGDGKADIAVWRSGASDRNVYHNWYILRSSDYTLRVVGLGLIENQNSSQFAPPADYDGDGMTDVATFTNSYTLDRNGIATITGNYFDVLRSSTNSITRRVLSNTFSAPLVPADYDGDGKADFTTYQDGLWTIEQSTNGAIRTVSFGLPDDIRVPADYDGDGKVDIAVWRISTGYWYWLSSRDGSFNSYKFGQSGDSIAPGDYDGDGRTDFAVFRRATGVWYIQQSRDGFRAEQFGLSGDIPL